MKINLHTTNVEEVNDRINSLFWIAFKVIVFLAVLGGFSVSAVKYIIAQIYH